MLRFDRYKYVYYVGYPPQLFDLQRDPEELNDLAADPVYRALLQRCEERLRNICDPGQVDARAKQRQQQLLELNGGRAAALAAGDLGFTPPPVRVQIDS